jgi:hypothetical protein
VVDGTGVDIANGGPVAGCPSQGGASGGERAAYGHGAVELNKDIQGRTSDPPNGIVDEDFRH